MNIANAAPLPSGAAVGPIEGREATAERGGAFAALMESDVPSEAPQSAAPRPNGAPGAVPAGIALSLQDLNARPSPVAPAPGVDGDGAPPAFVAPAPGIADAHGAALSQRAEQTPPSHAKIVAAPAAPPAPDGEPNLPLAQAGAPVPPEPAAPAEHDGTDPEARHAPQAPIAPTSPDPLLVALVALQGERTQVRPADSAAATAPRRGDAPNSDQTGAAPRDLNAPMPDRSMPDGPMPDALPPGRGAPARNAQTLGPNSPPSGPLTAQNTPAPAPTAPVDPSANLAALQTAANGAAAAPAPTAKPSSAATPASHTVSQEIIRRFDGGATSFQVRLDPAELGRVDIRIEVSRDKKVTATISADNPIALADLKASARELQRALTDSGLDLADNGLSFSDQRDSAPSRPTPDAWRARIGDPADEPAPVRVAASLYISRWDSARIDMWA